MLNIEFDHSIGYWIFRVPCWIFKPRSGYRWVTKSPLREGAYKNSSATIVCLLACRKMYMRKIRCRGRTRTSTGQLAAVQTVVVNPGRSPALRREIGSMLRLSCYPHPRDKGACLPKFHHSTVFYKNSVFNSDTILKNIGHSLQIIQRKF